MSKALARRKLVPQPYPLVQGVAVPSCDGARASCTAPMCSSPTVNLGPWLRHPPSTASLEPQSLQSPLRRLDATARARAIGCSAGRRRLRLPAGDDDGRAGRPPATRCALLSRNLSRFGRSGVGPGAHAGCSDTEPATRRWSPNASLAGCTCCHRPSQHADRCTFNGIRCSTRGMSVLSSINGVDTLTRRNSPVRRRTGR